MEHQEAFEAYTGRTREESTPWWPTQKGTAEQADTDARATAARR